MIERLNELHKSLLKEEKEQSFLKGFILGMIFTIGLFGIITFIV